MEAINMKEMPGWRTLRAELGALIDACNTFHQSLEFDLDGHYDEIPNYLDASRDFLRDVAKAQAALAATSETEGEVDDTNG